MKRSKDHTKQWRGQEVRMGDFLAWLLKGSWDMRIIDEIHRIDDTLCLKCDKPHPGKGWGWTYATGLCSVCDNRIKRELPAKTPEQWEAYGR